MVRIDTLKKVKELLNELKDENNIIRINNIEIKEKDIKEFDKIIYQEEKAREKRSETSKDYMRRNNKKHSINCMISRINKKPFKSERDLERLEELKRKREKIWEDMKKEKEKNMN